MRFAKHFAISGVDGAALAPGSHVISVHLGEFPDFILIRLHYKPTGKQPPMRHKDHEHNIILFMCQEIVNEQQKCGFI
ncbi:MAG: hypothetical protein MJY78_06055 [Fibrobacter sp.]|nr:hypothetical protein [Fibrobacter sp.]